MPLVKDRCALELRAIDRSVQVELGEEWLVHGRGQNQSAPGPKQTCGGFYGRCVGAAIEVLDHGNACDKVEGRSGEIGFQYVCLDHPKPARGSAGAVSTGREAILLPHPGALVQAGNFPEAVRTQKSWQGRLAAADIEILEAFR